MLQQLVRTITAMDQGLHQSRIRKSLQFFVTFYEAEAQRRTIGHTCTTLSLFCGWSKVKDREVT